MGKIYDFKICELISNGVSVPSPHSVEIGDEVDNSKISFNKVVIHAGCKIFGKDTLVSKGVCLGLQAPTTIVNCSLGINVFIGGGYFENSVFMDGVVVNCGSHFRSGTILEEFVYVANSVGLKNTILFPYVRLGSLINFCDALMSGGISNYSHSEIGSSYVHFNYTPHADKATPSLFGDVVRGISLRKKSIFLGGNGGVIGPSRVNYGTVVVAGSMVKGNYLCENEIIVGNDNVVTKNDKLFYLKVINNIVYLSNIIALLSWYRNVRTLHICDKFSIYMVKTLLKILELNLRKCILKFVFFCKNLNIHLKFLEKKNMHKQNNFILKQKKELLKNINIAVSVFFKLMCNVFNGYSLDEKLVCMYNSNIFEFGSNYIINIKKTNPKLIVRSIKWLKGITNEVLGILLKIFPSIK